MAPIVVPVASLMGMSLSLWALTDVCRTVVLDCMAGTLHMRQRILTSHWAESYTKMMIQMPGIDITMERLQETFVEVAEPFLE